MTPLILSLSFALSALPDGLAKDDRVVLEEGLTFVGVVAPESAPQGSELRLELYYTSDRALPPEFWNFLHLEAHGSPDCRVVQDRAPPPPIDGLITHVVTVRVPESAACNGATLNLYTGLYDRKTGRRVGVIEPRSLDDRILATRIEVTPAGSAAASPRAVPPSDMSGAELWARISPWTGWLIGLGLCVLLTWVVRRLTRSREVPEVAPPLIASRRIRGLVWGLILGVPMVLTFLAALDFIKDDAYISFRYAHNVVAGHGLVFNPGEYVEGITNFLWTVLMIPFEAMGWDLFIVSEWIGIGLTAGMLLLLARLTLTFTPSLGALPVRWMALLWAGLWLGTSSSLGLWSHSGMEQALAMFLPLIAAHLLWSNPDRGPDTTSPTDSGRHAPSSRRALWSGLFMGLGCVTRPEIHLMGVLIGMPLVIDVVRDSLREKRLVIPRHTLMWFVGLFAITVPVHGWRLAYYGSLAPNTFYVKTGDSLMVWLEGLNALREMFGFNATGVLFVLAPLAFLRKDRLVPKLVSLAIVVGFMVFIAKVGRDEMHWHRLYLPALPFLVLLASVGLINLSAALASVMRSAALVPWIVGWVVVLVATIANFTFTYREMSGFNGRSDLSGNYHPDMGKFVTRHDRPGALVAFQDMGSTPYYAPDIDFLDFIGLVDSTVARARYNYGLHAFTQTENSKNQPKYDADMRKYFYERNPEWTILTTYIPGGATAEDIARRFATDPHPRVLGDHLRRNGYQFGIVDERFEKSYVHVRTWPRSATYYLSLYRRKDLYDKVPGEVVLDAPPANMAGVKAAFEGDLQLLGSELEPTTKQRYEAFFTTWWRVPGPMPADTWFFFHVEKEGRRVPFDTLPGDFLYPANRWQPGQILEHRVLFQVPPDLPAGTYTVYMGVYRRSSGQRLNVLGEHDGEHRVRLGELTIAPLNPPWDSLIKPTDIELLRKYPERIIDHGRRRAE